MCRMRGGWVQTLLAPSASRPRLPCSLHQPLKHIDHLEFDVVKVQLRDLLRIARTLQPDHMRLRQAMRGGGDARSRTSRGAQRSPLKSSRGDGWIAMRCFARL